MRRSLMAIGLALCLLVFGGTGHNGAALFSGTISDKLDAPINRVIDTRGTPASVVGSILLDTAIPAGVVQLFPNCASESEIHLKVGPAETVRQALDALVTANPLYRWMLRDGLVIVSPSAGAPSILKTKVRAFRWSGTTHDGAPSVPLNKIIQMPEIRRQFGELRLSPGVHQGPGTQEVEINPVPRPATPIDINVQNLSLMDAFSAVIRAYGHGRWIYTETKCNQDGSTWYLLDSSEN